MKKRYQRNRNHFYLILEEDKLYKEDYQVRMILENEIKGLLKVQGRGMDEKSYFFYDITGKESLKKQYQKKTILKEEITMFLTDLLQMLDVLYEHMLDANSLLLRPEYIFQDESQSYFCYCPYEKRNLCKEFHKLTEFLVSQIDYEDRDSIGIVYELHKKTLSVQYDLSQLIKETLQKIEEQNQEYEEVAEVEMACENTIYPEYVDLPIKKKRKGRWGDWRAFEVEK